MSFSEKHCVPCEGGMPPLSHALATKYLKEVPLWEIFESNPSTGSGRILRIRREFKFSDFKKAMAFVDTIAKIAEEEGHHPDIHIFYNRVLIELWTHAINGLSENDFILATKIDKILK